jgi:opacity protein-like surface antigen
MKRIALTSSFGAVALAAVLWSTPAHAQTERPWSVSFDLGAQTAISGDAHGGGSGRVLNLPTSVSAKSYNGIFGPGFDWAAGLGYAVAPQGEIRVSGSYTSNPSERKEVGSVAGLPLFAKFDTYKAFRMDFGYRQYMGSGSFKPFIGGSAGFTRVEAINSTLTVPAANVTLSNVGFYKSSTVPSFSLGGGTQIALTENLAFQGGVNLRWYGDLKQNEGLAGTGLESINDESRQWTFPITAGVTVRF